MPALDRLPPANAHIRPHPLSTTIPRCRADLKAPKSFSAINRKPEFDRLLAEGWAFASFTDELIVAKTANATFTESADGVFVNGRGGLELRVLDLTTDQLVVDTYYDILGDSFPDHTITEDVFLRAGDTYVVFAAFEALAGTAANFSDTAYESKADMSDTGQLFIDAPPGTFTTLSGHDYSTDAGMSSAPEPSTWAMLLIGFAGLAFAGYRKSRRNAPIAV